VESARAAGVAGGGARGEARDEAGGGGVPQEAAAGERHRAGGRAQNVPLSPTEKYTPKWRCCRGRAYSGVAEPYFVPVRYALNRLRTLALSERRRLSW